MQADYGTTVSKKSLRENTMSDQTDQVSRAILPIPDSQHVGLTTYDAKVRTPGFAPDQGRAAAKGAPNVLVILIETSVMARAVCLAGL